jgi:TonB family protein
VKGPGTRDAAGVAGSGAVTGSEAASKARVYSALDLDVEPPALVSQVAQAGDAAGGPGVRVEPPRLLRPQLPSALPPTRSPDEVGVLEVLVNEEGNVERVRLISPANRFQDRMLVSAAKTWKFTPAMRDGRPVRYLARVTITL